MRLYKDPLEAYRINHDNFLKLDQKIKDRMWRRYLKHVSARQLRGLTQAFIRENVEVLNIKYNIGVAI